MRVGLYQIMDLVAEQTIGPVMPAAKDAAATRSFVEIIKSEGTQLHQAPADYALIKLGEQDNTTGAIDAHLPITVVTGAEVAEQLRLGQLSAHQQQEADSRPSLSQQR